MTDPAHLALVFVIGFACGVRLMHWLHERATRKRQERRERGNGPPWRVPERTFDAHGLPRVQRYPPAPYRRRGSFPQGELLANNSFASGTNGWTGRAPEDVQ